MTVPDEQPRKIAGHAVERISIGTSSLGKVVINDEITVLFRMNDGAGGGGPSSACTACKISKISACANLVCPEIKEADPNASCYDAINECVALACRGKCGSLAGGSGDILIIA